MWLMDVLGSAGFGAITGGLFGWLGKREERENMKMKFDHDLNMLQAKTDATIEVANYSNKGIYEEVQSVTDSSGSWLTNLVAKVWAYLVGYEDPSADSLNASATLKTVAENTEYGGY